MSEYEDIEVEGVDPGDYPDFVDLCSECCAEPDRAIGPQGHAWSDVGICPKCREHCRFVDPDNG